MDKKTCIPRAFEASRIVYRDVVKVAASAAIQFVGLVVLVSFKMSCSLSFVDFPNSETVTTPRAPCDSMLCRVLWLVLFRVMSCPKNLWASLFYSVIAAVLFTTADFISSCSSKLKTGTCTENNPKRE